MLDHQQAEHRLAIPYDTAPFDGTLNHDEKCVFHGQIGIDNQTGKRVAVHVVFHLKNGGYWVTLQDVDSPLSITANVEMVTEYSLLLGDDGRLYLIQS